MKFKTNMHFEDLVERNIKLSANSMLGDKAVNSFILDQSITSEPKQPLK